MKNKRTVASASVALAVIGVIVLVILIISNDYNSSVYKGDLYFFNESSTAIVAEAREIKYKDEADLINSVVEELMDGPDNGKNQRIIEKNTKLISVEGVETEKIVVNFSREFITDNSAKDILAIYAVVKSLCELDRVESVKVVIEGNDILSSDGSIIGYLKSQDINLSTDTYNSEIRELTLYFPNRDGTKLVKEIRNTKINDQQPLAQYIISALINGPENKDLKEALDEDTVLISVETSENICFVNFKDNFIDENAGTSLEEKMTIYSIVNSLTELDSIKYVQFLINGKRVDKFGDISIKSMFSRDEDIIG